MEVIDCRIEPLIQVILRQNIRFHHTLKEVSQYDQYAGNDFYIIDPFFSCSYRCLFTHYFVSICRDYRDGKVTKEDLDKCSTCDMNCVINNGLSEASKEQLKHKTGEEIVDADIAAQQMETK